MRGRDIPGFALSALRQAGAVVYDALVHETLLRWAPQAHHDYAGKRGGQPSARQRDISVHLVEEVMCRFRA